MAEFLEFIETVRAEEASWSRLFDGDVRAANRRQTPEYRQHFVEALDFTERVMRGQTPMRRFQEAMTTDDFPALFADIIDRRLLGAYRDTPATWQNYTDRRSVTDFRAVEAVAVDGAEGTLEEVAQRAEYPEAPLAASADQYSVVKHGRRLSLSWEMIRNDNLGAFMGLADRLGRAARRSEERFATTLFVGENGPNTSLYSASNANIITGNPELSIAGLQTAMAVLGAQRDDDGEPIVVDAVELVVPPALEVTAQNILNAIHIDVAEGSDTVRAQNWMRGRTRLNVNYYIPVVAETNGDTSWFLFANPQASRPALQMGFLAGEEEPAIFQRRGNNQRVGGGEVAESFETDSLDWKVRHVYGGTRLVNTGGFRATVASNGSGS